MKYMGDVLTADNNSSQTWVDWCEVLERTQSTSVDQVLSSEPNTQYQHTANWVSIMQLITENFNIKK